MRLSLLILLVVVGCTTENQKHEERRIRFLEMIDAMEAEQVREGA